MTLQEYMDKSFTVIDATSQGMSLQEAIDLLKCEITFDFADYEFDGLASDEQTTAIATILNAVVKGELVERYDVIENMCEEGFASVPFTITPPKPEIYNGKPHHAYKATCGETGNVYYGVTDDSGYAELKLSSAISVKGELKE